MRSHRRGFLARISRNLGPPGATFAYRTALEIVLINARRKVAWASDYCVSAVPAFDLNVGDTWREQFIIHEE